MTELIATYLQDHHAGSAAGVDAFDRVAEGHGDPEVRAAVARIADQVREDQKSLEQIMERVGSTVSTLKDAGSRLGEKTARLKPNERAIARSPLSDVVELEALMLAVHGKRVGFEALRDLHDPRLEQSELDELVERAAAQEAELGELRRTQLPRLLQD